MCDAHKSHCLLAISSSRKLKPLYQTLGLLILNNRWTWLMHAKFVHMNKNAQWPLVKNIFLLDNGLVSKTLTSDASGLNLDTLSVPSSFPVFIQHMGYLSKQHRIYIYGKGGCQREVLGDDVLEYGEALKSPLKNRFKKSLQEMHVLL